MTLVVIQIDEATAYALRDGSGEVVVVRMEVDRRER
jgi:hypothetical protein